MYNNPMFMMNPANNLSRTIAPNLIRSGATAANLGSVSPTNGGLFSRLATSLTGIKKINWSGLINNTSKTLGIINQSIPIVKQVGPMVGNMRSMMRVASIFKSETDPIKTPNRTLNTPQLNNNFSTSPNNTHTNTTKINTPTTISIPQEREYNESPIFFIN